MNPPTAEKNEQKADFVPKVEIWVKVDGKMLKCTKFEVVVGDSE